MRLERQAGPARHLAILEPKMVTSSELVRDIGRLDYLISLLTNAYPCDAEDREDLAWMRSRRDTLRALLAIRRAEQRNEVIRLEVWRDGGASLRLGNRKAA